MNKSICVSVLLLSGLIILGQYTHLYSFSNAIPIHTGYMDNDITDGHNSHSHNTYGAIMHEQLQQSLFDKYGCNYYDHKYTTVPPKSLQQTAQTQALFEEIAGTCKNGIVKSFKSSSLGEKGELRSTGQPLVDNLTEARIATDAYFVWEDSSEIFFKANSTSPAINVSNNTGMSNLPKIASSPDGNNVYVVWQDSTDDSFEILLAVSNDGGQNFSTRNLSNNTGESTLPQISSSGNNVYIVWRDTTNAPSDILFAVSDDGGHEFTTGNLSNNTGESTSPQISSLGNDAYVVWEDTTGSNRDIMFGVISNDGQQISTKNLGTTPGSSRLPQISLSGNNVYVVWQDFDGNLEIFFAVSPDGGENFDTKNLSNSPGASTSPRISSLEDNVYVVWQDFTPGNLEIFFAVSNDGAQEIRKENLSNSPGASTSPQISLSENNVYVVWEETTNAPPDIFFAVSNASGQEIKTKNLSNSPGASTSPQISLSGNNVYVVWQDLDGNLEIFFAASPDGGDNFDTKNLSNSTGPSTSPQISSLGKMVNIYVAWEDTAPGLRRDVFFAASPDGGDTFSPIKNISNNTTPSNGQEISSSGNNVYVVWHDPPLGSGNFDIFFATSDDNGQTFSKPRNISNNPASSTWPQISSSGNKLYVVWMEQEDIIFAVSNDAGKTFSLENISNDPGLSRWPQISSSGNNVYLVWGDTDNTSGNGKIFFATSNDGGNEFSIQNISDNTVRGVGDPQLSISGNDVYVVWGESGGPTNTEVFFAASNDSGKTFSASKNISNNPGHSNWPQISSSGNNVYVVWRDTTNGTWVGSPPYKTFFVTSDNNGQTFSGPKNLSIGPNSDTSAQISSSGDNVYVVWQEITAPSKFNVFFASSNDRGQTLSIKNLSNDAEGTGWPQISASGYNVYVVWVKRNTQGGQNSDIFFASSPDGGDTFTAKNISNNVGWSAFPQIYIVK